MFFNSSQYDDDDDDDDDACFTFAMVFFGFQKFIQNVSICVFSCVFHAHSCAYFLLLFCSWKYNYDDAVLSSVVELHETLVLFLVLFCNQRYIYDDTGFWLYLQARNSDKSLLLAGFLVFVPAAPPFLLHQVLLQVLRPGYS